MESRLKGIVEITPQKLADRSRRGLGGSRERGSEAETGRPPRTGPCYLSDSGLQTTAAEMRLSPFWGHGHLAVPAAQPSLARLCFRNRLE